MLNLKELLLKYHITKENPMNAWSPMLGKCKVYVNLKYDRRPIGILGINSRFYLDEYGRYAEDGLIVVFPSEDQHDWEKALRACEYSDINDENTCIPHLSAKVNTQYLTPDNRFLTQIESAATALFQLYILINQHYGGVVTAKDWADLNLMKYIVSPTGRVMTFTTLARPSIATFYHKEDAERFASYPSNLELLKESCTYKQ